MKRCCRAILALLVIGAMPVGAGNNAVADTRGAATWPHSAGQSSINVYKYTNRSGVTSFSDRAPAGRPYRIIEVNPGCYACRLDSKVDWHSTPLHLTSFQSPISRAATRYGIDPALIRAVIHAESAFKPNAKSRAGALGLMQLMPDTAREMGVADPLSPDDNIQGGVRYLAWLMQKADNNIMLATAAYNAGPGAVERHGGIPPYAETETYVRRVRILHDRYRKALSRSS